jgi:pimeloyl-ACP methyl ester carboxylesterase
MQRRQVRIPALPDFAEPSAVNPERDYFLSLHGLKIAVAEWGAESAPPILMLHGWLDNAATFATLAESLAGTFRCIAVDLPGHGHSSHLPQLAHYHFLDGVLHLYEICEKLGLERVALVGHSMGGALGMLYAGAFPERVARFVSIDAFGSLVRAPELAAAAFAEAVLEHVRRRESKKTLFATVDEALKARAAVSDCAPELLRPIVERSLQAVDGGFRWCSDARLRLPGLLRMSPDQVASFLRAVRAPTLVLKAEQGLSFVDVALRELGPLLPGMELVVLPGGHHLHLEQPAEVARRIAAFFQPISH